MQRRTIKIGRKYLSQNVAHDPSFCPQFTTLLVKDFFLPIPCLSIFKVVSYICFDTVRMADDSPDERIPVGVQCVN